MKYALIFIGGGLGAALRYWMQGVVHARAGAGFPYGTMAVNVLGSLLIGFLMVSFEERFLAAPSLRLFLTIGLLGGFTTFSSFSYETLALLRAGEAALALVNAGATVLACLTATWVGMRIGTWI